LHYADGQSLVSLSLVASQKGTSLPLRLAAAPWLRRPWARSPVSGGR